MQLAEFVVVLFSMVYMTETRCAIRRATTYCHDHVVPAQIAANSTSVVLSSMSKTTCFTINDLMRQAPHVKFLRVRALATHGFCECLLANPVHCGVTLDGCTTSALTGQCSPSSARSGGIPTYQEIVSALTTAVVVLCLIIPGVAGICFYFYRKKARQYEVLLESHQAHELSSFGPHGDGRDSAHDETASTSLSFNTERGNVVHTPIKPIRQSTPKKEDNE